MSEVTDKKQYPWRFQPGQSGNPAGRPKGARSKLQEDFLKALQEDFEAHGIEAVQIVRTERPEQYLKVIASIIPKELEIKRSTLDDLSDDELAAGIAALRTLVAESVPAGGVEAQSTGKPRGVH